jgi:autotransporter-associated beta strand protein
MSRLQIDQRHQSTPRFSRSVAIAAAMTLIAGAAAQAQTTYTWNNAATRLWLNAADWNPNSAFPGVAGVNDTNTDVALFSGVNPTSGQMGINSTLLTGGQLSLGAINNDLSVGTGTFLQGNAATTAGSILVTRLNGATIDPGTGPINNMLISISNNSVRDMTMQNTTAGGTGTGTVQQVQVGASGNIYVNSGRVLTISSALSHASAGLSVTKLGGGSLTLSGASNTTWTSGNIIAKEGTLNINGSNSLGTGRLTLAGGTIDNTSASAVLSLTTTDNPITLDANTTYLGSANRSINFNDSAVSLGTAPGTARTVTVANATTIFQLGAISDGTTANSIIKNGPGGLTLGGVNGGSTFTGSVTLNAGYLTLTQVATFASNLPTGGALGRGQLIINGGRLLGSVDTAASLITINSDFTVGADATIVLQNPGQNGRLGLSGPMDLGGVTRTITLASPRTAAQALTGSAPGPGLRFRPLGDVNAATNTALPTVLNGNLRLVADPAMPAGQYGTVGFGQAMNFDNNAGLIIGDRVITQFNSSFAFNTLDVTKLPAVTIEAGGIFNTSETTAVRSPHVYSLTGTGTVTSLANNASPVTATINIRNGGNSTFNGLIQDGADVAPSLGITSNTLVGVTMNGAGNQTLASLNTFTGPVSLNAGTLTTTTLANLGSASGIGKGTSATGSIILFGGNLSYSGATAGSTDRLFTLSTRSGGLSVDGVGTATFANTATIAILDAADRLGNLTDGSAEIAGIPSNVDLIVGMTVTGPGIPAGAKIASLNGFNIITLDQPVAGSTTGATLSFGNQNRTLALGGTNGGANTLAAAIIDSAVGTVGVTKNDAGTWNLTGALTYTGPTTVNGGLLNIASSLTTSSAVSVGATGTLDVAGGLVKTASLTLAAGSLLDLNTGDLIVEYTGTSPIADIIAALADGRIVVNGDFGGLPTTLAISEAADLGITDFSGVAVDDTTVVAKYTYVGDANLDGQVDALDYERVDLAIGNSGVFGTAQGDLNGDGSVDALDYEQIDLNIGNGVGTPLAGVFIPEPASLSLVALSAGLLGRRRRA